MRVLVVGAGALGSVFGCLLRHSGHEIGFVEPGDRLEDIRVRGLTVTGLFGEHRASGFELYSSADQVPVGAHELVLITVKSFHTREAVAQIAPRVGPDALVLSLQNGLGNYETILDALGEHRALAGRVIFGAQIVEPAHARVTVYAEPVMVGSPSNAVEMSRIEAIARAFSDAGIPSEPTREITRFIWAKILYNCALNPLSALLNVPYGRLLDTEPTRELMRGVVKEVFAVAQAYGVELFWQKPQ
ncbi:MAG: ketopantoate reductase family protein, partial [Armatimonadota bacterium]